MAHIYAESPRYFEAPLRNLEGLYAERRDLQARLALFERHIERLEGEVCRALRAARRDGIALVLYGDQAYRERDGRLVAETCAAAHEVSYCPEGADGRPWHTDDIVALTEEVVHGSEVARAADGSVIGERAVPEMEDRSC